MARRLRWSVCAVFVLVALGSSEAAVKGDGLPVGDIDAGAAGATAPGDPSRFVTLPARGDTVVARVERDGGEVMHSRLLQGNFTVPAVALDGSSSGLAADGFTLALIRPRARFPQRLTHIAVLNAKLLRIKQRVALRGDFSFDAISPDGDSLYLVQYLSRRDPTRYAVRAYDVSAGRLLPDPIVDPREPDEQMGGLPITRLSSPDGRWAYTLYDGAGKHPFVHALDTVGRTAACIDLDPLAGRRDLMELRLQLGDRLAVMDGRVPLAHIDTRTFRVEMVSSVGGNDGAGVSAPAWVAAGIAAALGGAVAIAVRRRRRLAMS